MDLNIQSKQSIINSIVHSQFRLASAFATIFDACLVTFAHILATYPLFVSFAIFRTVSKVKEKGCFSKTFCKFKILFEWEIYISYIPLNDYTNFKTVIFFPLTHIHTNYAFSSGMLFSIASAFQDFLSNQTHIVKILFWFLGTPGSTIDSIYELLLLSRAPQDSIDTTVSQSRLFLLL